MQSVISNVNVFLCSNIDRVRLPFVTLDQNIKRKNVYRRNVYLIQENTQIQLKMMS